MDKFELNKNYCSFLFMNDGHSVQSSYLSEFIAFIKSKKISSTFSFAYVGHETNLIPHLTLNENILMNFIPHSLTTDKLNQFEEFLSSENNYYLKKLYDKIIDKELLACHSTPETQKLTSLVKALTSDADYLFLENPERYLSENIRILFNKALQVHLKTREISAFFFCNANEELWKPQCSFTVSRNKYFQFQLESINVDETTSTLQKAAS